MGATVKSTGKHAANAKEPDPWWILLGLDQAPEVLDDLDKNPKSAGPCLKLIAKQMVQMLPESMKDNLRFNLQNKTRIVGTMCSGSDICVEALAAIVEECGGALHHKFSCEILPKNQLWIKQQMEGKCPDHLFEDVLSFPSGRGFCVLAGKTKMLPPAEIVYVGFSCKDVSRMNKHSSSSRQCIREASLRTGGPLLLP